MADQLHGGQAPEADARPAGGGAPSARREAWPRFPARFPSCKAAAALVWQQYLYGSQARHLSYNDFINKELILFSNSDNERSIPSLVDGASSALLRLRPAPAL